MKQKQWPVASGVRALGSAAWAQTEAQLEVQMAVQMLGVLANASPSMANMAMLAIRAQSGDGVRSLAVGLRNTF